MASSKQKQNVTIRVPATTANLGPGFDSLGLALSLWNIIRVGFSRSNSIVIHGHGENHLPLDKTNLIYRAASRLFQEVGQRQMPLSIEAWQDVPLSRGLGSSACAVVGGLLAANVLLDEPLALARLLELATELEGHPDNAAAALLGGFCVAIRDEGRVHAASIPYPADLQCVVFIPEHPMPTRQARTILPDQVSRPDAVFNIGRTALLVAGLATDHREYLELATQDRLHQPARKQLFPGIKLLFEHALNAGAQGVFLSGAGSSVVALTHKSENRAMTIGYEMANAADKSRIEGSFMVLDPCRDGAAVLAADSAK